MRGIGIIGRARTGKDTVAARLADEHAFVRVALADPLKCMAYDVNPVVAYEPCGMGHLPVYLRDVVDRWGWESVKDRYPEARRFLQRLGSEGVREHVGTTFWLDQLCDDIDAAPSTPFVVPDVRFPNEARALLRRGFALVYLARPGIAEDGAHSSETLGRELCTHVVLNDGTLTDLHRKIDELVSEAS
ncbi:deoxynucleotide monophosphate kinase family protein [Kitasatospora sp. NPDC003701]